jgi:hypothetical protein
MEFRLSLRVLAGVVTTAVLFTGPFARKAHANSSTTIVNEGSGMCLEVVAQANDPNNFAINGLKVVQAPCNGSTEQLWDITFHRLAWVAYLGIIDAYHIVNRRSGMCMDLTDGNLSNQTPIQQWTCNSTSTTMDWSLGTAVPYANIVNHRALQHNLRKCLDIRRGSLWSGAAVQSYDCTWEPTNTAQRFTYINP